MVRLLFSALVFVASNRYKFPFRYNHFFVVGAKILNLNILLLQQQQHLIHRNCFKLLRTLNYGVLPLQQNQDYLILMVTVPVFAAMAPGFRPYSAPTPPCQRLMRGMCPLSLHREQHNNLKQKIKI